MTEFNSPNHKLFVEIRDQLLPRDNLSWAREALLGEYQDGSWLGFAVNCVNLVKKFIAIYCDEALTEAEKEAAYHNACDNADPKNRYQVVDNYYEDLLTKFKALPKNA